MAAELVTTGGRLSGRDEGTLAVYLGIPYAAPPTGALRWRPPVPAPRWSGTLAARSFGPAAPQTDGPPSVLPNLDPGAQDEDCLTLNVWAPTDARDRPVLVWIHGGAFISGGTAIPSYDGSRLAAEHDVVVVSMNYRLGALGFAPIGGVANLGLLDQLLALEWVHDNVAEFGGDPELVTIFGESAGGGAIMHLLSAPATEGLARRAIVQSGATTLTLSADAAGDVAERVRGAIGIDPFTAPVGAILEAQDRVAGELIAAMGTMPFHPAIDHDLVVADPRHAPSAIVDLLIGTTANELNTYLDPAAPSLEPERLAKRAARYLPRFGVTDPGAVLAGYDDLTSPSEVWAAIRTDAEMWLPAVTAASAHHGTTHMYRFDWPAAPPNAHLKACHAIDIPFTFGTFDREGWGPFVGHNRRAEDLGEAMREAWTLFAATGDPSTKRLGEWPAYTAPGRATMILDDRSRLELDPRGRVRQAWTGAPPAQL